MTETPSVAWPHPDTLHTVMFDFDGVFTDNTVYVSQDGSESVRCSRADGLAIEWLRRYAERRQAPLHIRILSTETNAVVAARARKLQVPCIHAVGDKLAHVVEGLARDRPTDPEPFKGLLYAGNDLNDLLLMRRAGFSVAPADADSRIRNIASTVLPHNGGCGFVRALVEQLLRIGELTGDQLDEFVSNR